MPGGFYVCDRCKDDGKDFRVPADEIGIEIMKAHLKEQHGVDIR